MPEAVSDPFARLKQITVFISGPDGTGTGYLIAPQRIATALHVVKSWKEGDRYKVIVGVKGRPCQARLLKSDPAIDAAILGFDEVLDVKPLPVAEGLKRNVVWEGYGFPALANKVDVPTGLPIDGQVKDPITTNDTGQPAVLLFSPEIAAGNASPLHGFSGSPVMVEGALVGHLVKHIGDPDDKRRAAYGYVYACPIDEVVKILDVPANKVLIEPPRLQTLAEAIPKIESRTYHVFVSYRSTDRAWALSLVARLEGAGLKVFIDQRELALGESLAGQLESALTRSRAAVLLVSKGWLESPWCQEEASVLKKRAVEDGTFKLIPLRLDTSDMPPFLDARLWLDFKGTAQAEGENLDRLLNALLNRTTQASSPEARAQSSELQVTDLFVSDIKDAARGDQSQILKIVEKWRKTASTDIAPLIAAAEVLIGKAEFRSALQVLEGAAAELRVRQLRAFALRKNGDIDQAIALFEALYREGQLDAETFGLLAGSYKARWLKGHDPAYMRRSYQIYQEGYERTGDSFNGINTASMALQCGDLAKMYEVAAKVRDQLLKRPVEKLDYWDLATLGEAFLLLQRYDDARDWYGRASGMAAGLHQNIAVMRKQARRNLEKLGQPKEKLDDVLTVPIVLVYFGHMVDADDRSVPRFPAERVGALRKLIRTRLEKYGALHGFGQASRGTDLIVLEELAKRDLSATVVLPFPENDFLATSVGGRWNDSFAKLRENSRITFEKPIYPSRPPDDQLLAAFDDANRSVQKKAITYAQSLDDTPIVILAVWDGKKGDGPGGTADAVSLWRDEGYDVDVIDVTKL